MPSFFNVWYTNFETDQHVHDRTNERTNVSPKTILKRFHLATVKRKNYWSWNVRKSTKKEQPFAQNFFAIMRSPRPFWSDQSNKIYNQFDQMARLFFNFGHLQQ